MQNNNLIPKKAPHHGDNVKKFRMLRGFKQEVFAEMLGKYDRWLYEVERKPVIDDETLQLIADKLQIHIDILKSYTDDCDIQINYNGTTERSGGDFSTYTKNNVNEITAVMKPLYDEINQKNIEIYKLNEEIKLLSKKK